MTTYVVGRRTTFYESARVEADSREAAIAWAQSEDAFSTDQTEEEFDVFEAPSEDATLAPVVSLADYRARRDAA